jgi:Tfp pilus assembly protein PilV
MREPGSNRVTDETGFGLIELVIAMVILQVALLALVGVFSSSSVALGRAAQINTAAALADQQMELYRAMPYDAIGLDTTATLPSTYTSDTSVCPTGGSTTCNNSAPVNNTSTDTWSCAASPPNGYTSVATYFTANGINPCTAHRQVTGPDGHSYAVDTYIQWGTLITGTRPTKQVSVVVRKTTTTTELTKIVSTFDCSTGNVANAAPC